MLADSKPLAAGTYEIRVTPQEAKPQPAGQTPQLERWVQFVQDGQVKGREVVTIVPSAEIAQVIKEAPLAPGSARVETLKGGRYLRIWVNRDGVNYLLHLPPALR